jgi:hypothetical protein
MRRALTIALLVSLAGPGAARAQPGPGAKPDKPAPTTEERNRARAKVLLDAGNKLQAAGDHLGALELFRQAYRVYASPNLFINIGTSLWNLGRYTEAARAFEKAVADARVREEKKAELRGHLATLDKLIGKLDITVNIDRVTVEVDGKRLAAATRAATVRVDPGPHTVVGTRKGWVTATRTVTVAKGARVGVGLRLVPIPKPRTVAPEVIERVVLRDRVVNTRGAVAGLVHVAIDPLGPGAAVLAGASYGIGDRIDVSLAGIIGGSFGIYAAGTFFVTRGPLRPTLSVGVPAFFIDGITPGLRGAVGLEWIPTRRLGIVLRFGAEHYPGIDDSYVDTIFVPTLGVQSRI